MHLTALLFISDEYLVGAPFAFIRAVIFLGRHFTDSLLWSMIIAPHSFSRTTFKFTFVFMLCSRIFLLK